MRQFYTITANSFMELVRQPVCLLLTSSSAVFMVFLACVPYFGLGEDPRMVKDSVLAVMFVAGLLGAVLSAAASVAHEIRAGTALAVLSKPVSRLQFLLAKYVGVAAALTLMTYVNAIAALTASRMAYDAYGSTDRVALAIFVGAVALAYGVGGFSNYFLRRQFVADAIMSLAVLVTLAFLLITNVSGHLASLGEAAKVDWRLVPASLLILFALWMAAGLAVACSTRLDMIPTLAVVTGFFLLGMLSPWLFGRLADAGSWWASVLYALVPNWQLFWMADTLEKGKAGVPVDYLLRALGYTVGYLGAVLMAALLLFEDRELS
jgi:ABC-2 type transport system permease protein